MYQFTSLSTRIVSTSVDFTARQIRSTAFHRCTDLVDPISTSRMSIAGRLLAGYTVEDSLFVAPHSFQVQLKKDAPT